MNPFLESAEAFNIHLHIGEIFEYGRFHTEVSGYDLWLVQSLDPDRDCGEFWVCDSNGDALSAKYSYAGDAVEALADMVIYAEDNFLQTA